MKAAEPRPRDPEQGGESCQSPFAAVAQLGERLFCKQEVAGSIPVGGFEVIMYRKILCVDFDGVLHSYKSGWKGPRIIPDPPVPGAIAWLMDMSPYPESLGHMVPDAGYEIHIYSSRSKHWGGRRAMKKWLVKHGLPPEFLEVIKFPTKKPAAYLTIDDRAICFKGTFPTKQQMDEFKPWNK